MDKYLQNIVGTIQDLISFNSIQEKALPGKPFGEANFDCLEKALETCKRLGFKTKNCNGYCGWAEIGDGELFAILAHLDVVPAGNDWDHDPFAGDIANGVLYGRGVLDDKGPAVCCIYAIKKLMDEGYTFKNRIRIIFGCNEETGWKCMEYYFAHEEVPKIGFSPDADFPVINCEKGVVNYKISTKFNEFSQFLGGERPNMVPDRATVILNKDEKLIEYCKQNNINFEKNDDKLKLTTFGISAHGSTPNEGKNAIIEMLKVLSNFNKDIKFIYNKLNKTNGENVGLNLSDEKSGNLSMNVGTVNLVDNNLEFMLDIRYPISYEEKDIRNLLKENLPNYKIERTHYHAPLYVDKDHPLVKKLLDAYNKIMNEKAEPITIGGGTYARALETGVAFGPIFPNMVSTIHQKNECVKISDLKNISKIYYEAIKSLCTK